MYSPIEFNNIIYYNTMHIFNDNEYYDSTIAFIKTNNTRIIKKYKDVLKNIIKTSHFRGLIKTAIKSYEERDKPLHISDVFIKLVKSLEDASITDDDLLTPFISDQIRTDIKKSISSKAVFCEYIKLTIKNITFNINSLHGDKLINIDIIKLTTFLQVIVPFLLEYSETNKRELDIYLYLLPTLHRKTFNDDCEISLSSNNINSGFTTHIQNTKRIFIFRIEECYKVLLHELIHALGLDLGSLCNIQGPKIKRLLLNIRKCFNIHDAYNNGKLLIEETYTEFWTSFIYTLFYSIERTQKLDKIKNVSKTFMNRYSVEYVYSVIKAVNIIKYNTMLVDFTNSSCIYSTSLANAVKTVINTNDTPVHSAYMLLFNKKTQTTNTSMFEYYIIKMIFMSNINTLFELRSYSINPINVYCSHEQIYKILLFVFSCLTIDINKTTLFYDLIEKGILNTKTTETLLRLYNSLSMTTFC
jgi:hypothetical protein